MIHGTAFPRAGLGMGMRLTGLLLFGLLLRLPLAFVRGYESDMRSWEAYARYAVENGLGRVYDLTLQDPHFGVYPPLYFALLGGVGWVYRLLFSPEFEMETATFDALMKLVPILGDLAVAAVIYVWARAAFSEKAAALACLAIVANPALVYTSAYWGMFGDSAYTLCIVAAVAAVDRRMLPLAVAAAVAAFAMKPQALAFAPFLVLAMWHFGRARQVRPALAAGGGTALLIISPFLVAGTVPDMVEALTETVGLFPVLSANALNFWHLVSLGDGWRSDAEPLLGPLTARWLGVGALGLANLVVLSRQPRTGPSLFQLAAYVGFAFLLLSTQMHENYLYPAVALSVAAAASGARPTIAIAAYLTAASLLNMALFDPKIEPSSWLPGPVVDPLRLAVSATNVLVFAGWTVMLVTPSRTVRSKALSSA